MGTYLNKPLDQHALERVLLAEEREVGLYHVQELGHDGGHAPEEARPCDAFRQIVETHRIDIHSADDVRKYRGSSGGKGKKYLVRSDQENIATEVRKTGKSWLVIRTG